MRGLCMVSTSLLLIHRRPAPSTPHVGTIFFKGDCQGWPVSFQPATSLCTLEFNNIAC